MSDVLKKIEKAFKSLMKKRQFFVSEADFQHSFAIELRDNFKGKNDAVYLEYPIKQGENYAYIDIVLVHEKRMYPIELKYKTKKTNCTDTLPNTNQKACDLLKTHSAQDLGAYDFLYDVYRIEKANMNAGVAIMLTNDPWYWTEGKRESICDAFRINQDREISGNLDWNLSEEQKMNDKHFTRKRPGFELKNEYKCKWSEKNGAGFKYLYVEIPPKDKA
jgi:hypothetical protein